MGAFFLLVTPLWALSPLFLQPSIPMLMESLPTETRREKRLTESFLFSKKLKKFKNRHQEPPASAAVCFRCSFFEVQLPFQFFPVKGCGFSVLCSTRCLFFNCFNIQISLYSSWCYTLWWKLICKFINTLFLLHSFNTKLDFCNEVLGECNDLLTHSYFIFSSKD